MEQVRTARRSASHGALDRRYAADNSFYPRMVSSSNPFARPLRSVNENTSLLASPGPLESMLKTTTETGDIGIFSIKPSWSSASVHAPLRPRPGYGDTNWKRPPRGNRTETPGFRGDRSHFPRYRDTASEIISMYGSGSQRSASSSLSHPYDDLQRVGSYSMTSCSSRPLQNKKSNGTLRSQSSGTYLQRPRSPFPYPTRLKRPGVRPSSPAWTENGGVDYSRMIQIDRLSHRTVHGLYKPTYAHYGRRVTPGLSRLDINKSVPSLSSYNTQPGFQYSSGQTSSAPTTWGGRYRDRLESGRSDNSLRSSSLTSIVDMYRPPSCAQTRQDHYFRTQSGGAFYYDYSEDFDEAPPIVRPSLAPLAPVPTRAPSLHRPMVLDEGCSMRLDDANNRNPTKVLHATFPIELGPGQEVLNNREGFSRSMESLQNTPLGLTQATQLGPPIPDRPEPEKERHSEAEIPRLGENTHRQSDFVAPLQSTTQNPPDECRAPVPAAVDNLDAHADKEGQTPSSSTSLGEYGISYEEPTRTSAVSVARSSSQPQDIHRSMSLSNEKKESISSTVSGYLRRSKFYSLEPGLSDLASLVQCLDKAAQSSGLFDTSSDTVIVQHEDLMSSTSQELSTNNPSQIHSTEANSLPISPSQCLKDYKGGEFDDFRAYRSQDAVSKFGHDSTSGAIEMSSLREMHCAIPIFAPQPISPARRLKLQNSIPQLMKALPPLPNPRESVPGGQDMSMRFSPEYEGDDTTMFKEHIQDHRDFKSNNAKLKIRVSRRGNSRIREVPVSSGQSVISESSGLWFQDPSRCSQDDKNSCGRASITATIKRIPEDAVVNLEACIEEVACQSSPESTGSVIRHGIIDDQESLTGGSISPQKTLHSASVASISDLRSTFSDGSSGSHKPPRGLRKRVSDLRIRLAESRLKSAEPRGSPGKQNIDVGVGTTSTLTATSTAVGVDDSQENKPEVDDLGQPHSSQSRGFRGRMSKWMTTVRQAVMVACTGSRKRG